jgi:hypothetical protein
VQRGRFLYRPPSSGSEAADDERRNQVSDEQLDRAEEQAEDEDVEAHGFSAPVDAPIDEPHANEEPPDVEGHHMGAPVDRPVDAPVD